jgi:hypothetical protein
MPIFAGTPSYTTHVQTKIDLPLFGMEYFISFTIFNFISTHKNLHKKYLMFKI